jgi:hypothetical protein
MVLRPTGEASSAGAGQAAFVPAVVPGTELERLHFDAGGWRVRVGRQIIHFNTDITL